MKKLCDIFILGVIIALSCSSCGFLDKHPDSSTDINIKDIDKISELLAGAYPNVSYFRFLETRTDNVGDRGEFFEASALNRAMYYWRDFNEETEDSPVKYWIECYRGIAQANAALEQLSLIKDKQNIKVRALYGEALLLRAYLHFMIANIWAKPYPGPDEAALCPGIPYMESSEKYTFVKYDRGTLQETYDKIKRDLVYGVSLINESCMKHPKFRFNKKAAYAFAVRFFTTIADWDKVIEYSDYVLTSQPELLLQSAKMWSEMSDRQRRENYSSPENKSNLLIVETESLIATNIEKDRYALSERVVSDVFYRQLSKTSLRQTQGYVNSVKRTVDYAVYCPKFLFFTDASHILNPDKGYHSYNVLFSVEEVMLDRIEAYAMTEQYDLAFSDLIKFIEVKHKVGDMETPPERRTLEFVFEKERNLIQPFYRPLHIRQSSIFYIVSELRRQEFIHEGMRWFDLRRFNIGIDRNLPGEVRNTELVLKPEDSRKTMQIPVIAINNGITAN